MATKTTAPNSYSESRMETQHCPDPSAHTKNSRMQQAASTAALYATNPSRDVNRERKPTHDSQKKLSAAGAATSLKYANPQDLPAFPIVGVDAHLSPGMAATTANANRKDFNHWKPEKSDSAEKAAMLANMYKASPAWKPEASTASSRAALLAHQDVSRRLIVGKGATKEGSQAAGFAMRKSEPESRATGPADSGIGKDKALIAATGAFTGRKRSESLPAPVIMQSDLSGPSNDALNAASMAHTPLSRQQTERSEHPLKQTSSVRYSGRNFPREMFTEHPPVQIEVDEKNRQDALRASALSMAKQMYQVQQSQTEAPLSNLQQSATTTAATKAHGNRIADSDQDLRQQALQYVNIQEAAQRLAMERLAKIQTDDSKAYRDYYGYSTASPRNRLSKHLGRRRSSSDSNAQGSEYDEEMSRRIKTQMAVFNSRVTEVDIQKRQKDREILLAAAEKRVQAQMLEMDEKVFTQTGKIPPAMMEEWERAAHARATVESEARMTNHGKVHIGGGRYIDQSDIDAVAASRIRPTLDEIEEAAARQRARDEEIRLDQEEQKRQIHMQKQHDSELKAEEKRIKNDEKLAARTRRTEEKNAARSEKAAQKARKLEEKRVQKERRKSKATEDLATQKGFADPDVTSPSSESQPKEASDPAHGTTSVSSPSNQATVGEDATVTHPTDQNALKLFLNKLKRRSKGPSSDKNQVVANTSPEKGPLSEITVPGPELDIDTHQESPSVQRSRSISSISDNSLPDQQGEVSEVSEVSDVSDGEFEEARDTLDDRLAPQPNFTTEGRMSIGSGPPRDSRFQEDL